MLKILKETDRSQLITAGVIFAIAFLTYLSTVAPSVSFWDCGEYIATAYTMAVPHPPGAPFFLLLGRLFSMLPTGDDIGYRVNLLSSLSSALTVMFVYLIIVKLINQWKGNLEDSSDRFIAYTGGIIGALSFAWSDSFWFNAVEAEVYAMSALFTAIVVWLALHWLERSEEKGSERYLLLIAYMMGLALDVHLLNLLALPTIALIVYFKRYKVTPMSFFGVMVATLLAFIVIYLGILKGIPRLAAFKSFWWVFIAILILYLAAYLSVSKGKKVLSLTLFAVILVTVGYSTYTLVYVRANAQTSINENNPNNEERLVKYLNREQYGDAPILDRKRWKPRMAGKYSGEWDYFWRYQIDKMYIRYFKWQFVGRADGRVDWSQFYGLPLLLGLFGTWHHYRRDPKQAFNVLVLFFMTGLAVILYLNQEDPQPRERDYSYVGSFMAFAFWIGIGAAGVLEWVREFRKENSAKGIGTIVVSAFLIFVVPVNMLVRNYATHDRSGNFVAWDYSYNILQTCEKDGIIFTNGDNDTFPLWYLQEVEGIRKDVRVVNLSLLNTKWYIKQLRDYEPKLPINLTDREIDALFVQGWPRNGRDIRISGPPDSTGAPTEMKWKMMPTYKNSRVSAIRVQDLMILHILDRNKWKKPIYFAVTVSPENKIGLEEYLRMDGLAFRIVPMSESEKKTFSQRKPVPVMMAELIEPDKIERNLFEKYKYRNLNNPDVYYAPNVQKLLQNYRSAFLQLAWKYLSAGETEKVAAALEKMNEVIPESVIPIRKKEAQIQLGLMEKEAGFPEKLKERLDRILEEPGLKYMDKLVIASYYLRDIGDYDTSERIFRQLYEDDPENPNTGRTLGFLVSMYDEQQRYVEAVGLLEEWLAVRPDDGGAKARLAELQRKAKAAGSQPEIQ